MKKKKLAFFLPYLDVGGIEKLYVSYANHLTDKYDVSIITCSDRGVYRNDIHNVVHVVVLSGTRIRTSFFKLVKVIRQQQYDYLIGSNILSNMVMLVAKPFCHRTKFIAYIHSYVNNEIKHIGLTNRFFIYFMKWLYYRADKIIAVSSGIKKYIIQDLKIPSERVEIIYNAVDIKDIIAKSQDSVNCLVDNYIIFVGRLSIVKNLPFLIKCFEVVNYNGLKLLIIGDGPYEEEVRLAASKSSKKDDILFLGALSNPMPYIKKARCLVLPSSSESFGLVLLEALCLERPVVASPTKGALEVLEGCKDAFISTTFDDIFEFAGLIVRACNHSCIDNRDTVNRFSVTLSVEKLSEILKSL